MYIQCASKPESECKCLTCSQKLTGSQFSLLQNQTKSLMGEKLKRKPLSSLVSVKPVQWKGWGLWWEGFKEKVSFEFRVENSRSDGQ